MPKVKVCIKEDAGKVALSEIDVADPGEGQALIRTSRATICGSDIHVRDDIPEVPVGMPMGHEGVGIVEAVGPGVEIFKPGDRVVSCCLTSCGDCAPCSRGDYNICAAHAAPMNLIFGAQGEAFVVNGADHSMARIPEGMDDDAALMTADILSTGLGAIERGGVKPGASVAIFAQGPVGLCATLGAKHYGAEMIIGVESVPERVAMAKQMGATHVVAPDQAVEQILEMTGGAGVDVAVEALGKQLTFENCCKVTRLGGTVSSVGVYGGIAALTLPTDGSFIHRTLVTTFCPAGTARLEHLLGLIESGSIDPTPLLTHTMTLDEIVGAYDMFERHADGCLKISIRM